MSDKLELLSYKTFLLVWRELESVEGKALTPPFPMGVYQGGPRKCYFEWQHKWERMYVTLKAQYYYCMRCEMYRVEQIELCPICKTHSRETVCSFDPGVRRR